MALTPLLRLFFRWLYHSLAFAYDLVAAVVSAGHWNEWTRAVQPYLRGSRILELGHGPGHLQQALQERYPAVIGLDESRQMGRLALRRLMKAEGGYAPRLVRCLSQCLPFPKSSFDSVVSTFPSEYIAEPDTISEVIRVLSPQGRLVVLPAAWPRNRFLNWLFKVTGEAPSDALDLVKDRLMAPFQEAGLKVKIQTVQIESGTVLIMIAENDKDSLYP